MAGNQSNNTHNSNVNGKGLNVRKNRNSSTRRKRNGSKKTKRTIVREVNNPYLLLTVGMFMMLYGFGIIHSLNNLPEIRRDNWRAVELAESARAIRDKIKSVPDANLVAMLNHQPPKNYSKGGITGLTKLMEFKRAKKIVNQKAKQVGNAFKKVFGKKNQMQTSSGDQGNIGGDGPSNPDDSSSNNADNANNSKSSPQQQLQFNTKPMDVPDAKWPIPSIDTESFEEIAHPADNSLKLMVPKLWSLPVHHDKLMSRELAMKIGICIEPDPITGSFTRGDACPVHQRTIFVAIASYRDYQCSQTVESIFRKAKYPERVRVTVVDQIRDDGSDPHCNVPVKETCEDNPNQPLCKYKNQIDVYTVKAEYSCGPVFARHLGHRMYRGEYYATQSDAHVTYVQDWDENIITQMEDTHNEMAVLSTYLSDVKDSIDNNGYSLRNTRPIMCNTDYEGGPQGNHLRHGSQPEDVPYIRGSPQLQPYWAAGYSFSRGHFIVNVPYDPFQPMIFQGEEMGIGIRGFTIGYDFYAPERSVCFHHYAPLHPERNKVHHFWENQNRYAGTGKKGMKRLLGIVHMNPEVPLSEWDHTEEKIYGIGDVRKPEVFYKVFGIDVVNQKVQHHLCYFVAGGLGGGLPNMHKLFTQKLRSDGMGIDYSLLDFSFVDPSPNMK